MPGTYRVPLDLLQILTQECFFNNYLSIREQFGNLSKIDLENGEEEAKKISLENQEVDGLINHGNNSKTQYLHTYFFASYFWEYVKELDFFYEYILANKENMFLVCSILDRLRRLGFKSICFNSEFDFSQDIYTLYAKLEDNYEFYYENGLKFDYQGNGIYQYKSDSSPYKLLFHMENSWIEAKEAYLNNLFFPSSLLPVHKEDIWDFQEIISENNRVLKRTSR